jgi:uncharacterized protein (DUF1800 family)
MALGNFRDLTQAMALTPAMLVYLSNGENVKGEPNENFARELMELFTMGVGNYTEQDVAEVARAWTGYNYDWDGDQYIFRANKHDTGMKTIFGTTKAWKGPEVIDEILLNNTVKRNVAANYIAKKLWDFLAYPNGPAVAVTAIADELKKPVSGQSLPAWNLRDAVRVLLKRPEFYSVNAKQGMVRTPIEYFVALAYHAGWPVDKMGLGWRSEGTGQHLYNPPNVSGWRHNSYWLNTGSLSGRADFARSATWHLRKDGGHDFLNDMTTDAAVDYCAQKFGIHPLSSTTRTALVNAQNAERAAQNWKSWWSPTSLLTMTMLTPEFHQA